MDEAAYVLKERRILEKKVGMIKYMEEEEEQGEVEQGI